MNRNKYTKEEIDEARQVDLVELLIRLGYDVKHSSGNEYYLAEHDSLKISPHKGWYWHSRDYGGHVIDFFMNGPYDNMSFIDAVTLIRKTMGMTVLGSKDNIKDVSRYNANKRSEAVLYVSENRVEYSTENQSFMPPPKAATSRRVFAYLMQTRGIDKDIISSCMKKGLIYEEEEKHNVVFAGFNKNGEMKAASRRSTLTNVKWRGDAAGSDKEYGFHITGKTDTVHIFESAIDALSFMTLQKMAGQETNDSYITLDGTSPLAVSRFLNDYEDLKIKNLVIRTDNDDAGKKTAQKITEKFKDNYKVITRHPKYEKDYNDVLLKIRAKEREMKGFEI